MNNNSKKTDEIDIYSDILTDQDAQITKLKEKFEKISTEKNLLIKSLSAQQQNYEKLQKDYQELLEKYRNISLNTSSLFKTAQAEIARKDRTIHELRRELDNLIFRKNPANHRGAGRARREVEDVESRGTAPLKKNESPAGPGPPFQSSRSDVSKPESTSNVSVKVNHKNNEIPPPESKTSDSTTICKTSTPELPPLMGPVTEYSKRMYKKIYGVEPAQPLQTESTDQTTPRSESKPFKDNRGKITDENDKHKVQESKIPKVVTKLQEEVKEIIKLGIKSKDKSPTEKNLGAPKNETFNHINIESTKEHHLVIHCGFQDSKSPDSGSSPNSHVNETINNILKNHHAGMYSSNNKLAEEHPDVNKIENVKKKNTSDKTKLSKRTEHLEDVNVCDKDSGNVDFEKAPNLSNSPLQNSQSALKTNKNRPNRLLENLSKRVSNKPAITPVTFGKLISPKSIYQKSPNLSKSNVQVVPSDKTYRSNNTFPIAESNENFKFLSSNAKHFSKGKKSLVQLFGESPLKSNENIKLQAGSSTEKCDPEDLKGSSIEKLNACPDSPVFPSSSSLDSDDPEDLVIDTTAGSRNTSPRVSESFEKETERNSEHLFKGNKNLLSPSNKKNSNVVLDHNIVQTNLLTNLESESAKTALPQEGNSSKQETLQTSKKKFAEIDIQSVNFPLRAHPQIIPKNDKSCLSDLSDFVSCQGSNHNEENIGDQIVKCNESTLQTVDEKSPALIVTKETSSDFGVELSHSSSNEICENNSSTDKTVEVPVSAAERFIPSPTQLTLVSAFKHSENSVFNIAEDTAEFVKALTRVRDISPIRTPDKNIQLLNASNPQLKTSETSTVEQHHESNLTLLNSLNTKPSSGLSFQNVAIKENKMMVSDIKKYSLEPIEFNSPDKKEPDQIRTLSSDNILSNLVTIQSGESLNENCNDRRNEEMFKSLKSNISDISTRLITGNEFTSPDSENVFKRSRRERRVLPPGKIAASDILRKTDENSKPQSSSRAETSSSVAGSFRVSESECDSNINRSNILCNSKENNKEENRNNIQYEVSSSKNTKQTATFREVSKEIRANVECCDNENQFSTDIVSKLAIISNNVEKISFKRSESLKTKPKPKPKIDYDILNRVQEDEVSVKKNLTVLDQNIKDNESSLNTTRKGHRLRKITSQTSSEEEDDSKLQNEKPTVNVKRIDSCRKQVHEIGAKELEQIPHIANINKKTRVSNFKRVKHDVEPVKETKDGGKNSKKYLVESSEKHENKNNSSAAGLSSPSKLEQVIKAQQPPKTLVSDKNLKNRRNVPNISKATNDAHVTQKNLVIKESETPQQSLKENVIVKNSPTKANKTFSQENPKENKSEPVNKIHQRRLLSSIEDESRNRSIRCVRRSQSKSPESKRTKCIEDHRTPEGINPQIRYRSKSYHRPRERQMNGLETKGRSKSHIRNSERFSPDWMNKENRHNKSFSRSPESHVILEYKRHVSERSRSSSRERFSGRSSRPRHRSSSKRYVSKYNSSRSRSPQIYERRREYHYRHSRGRSPDNRRKRRSRSSSSESWDRPKRCKRMRESRRTSTNDRFNQHVLRSSEEFEHITNSHEKSLKKSREKTFNYQDNKPNNNRDERQGVKVKESLSFLEEIEEVKKHIHSRTDKNENSSDDEPDSKVTEATCQESMNCLSFTTQTKSSSKLSAKVSAGSTPVLCSKSSAGSTPPPSSKSSAGSTPPPSSKSSADVSKVGLPASTPVSLSVQSKPIPLFKYKRRSRNLGDSDVTVVSSSTKLSSLAACVSKSQSSVKGS